MMNSLMLSLAFLVIIEVESITDAKTDNTSTSCVNNYNPQEVDAESISTLRSEMIDLFRIAASMNWDEGIDGHMSASIGNGLMLINRFGTNWGAAIDCDIITVNTTSFEILSPPPIERDNDTPGKGLTGWRAAIWMNAAFHREFEHVKVALHLHSPHVRTIGIAGDKIKMIDQNSLRFFNRIIYSNYSGIIVSAQKSDKLVNLYKNENEKAMIENSNNNNSVNRFYPKDIIFMRNHGVLILANSVFSAFNTAYFLEIAAKTQIDATMYAQAAGTEVVYIDEELQAKTAKKFQGWSQDVFGKNNFQGFRRKLHQNTITAQSNCCGSCDTESQSKIMFD